MIGQDRDLERVAEEDGVFRQALGARGADEIELEHLEQAAAGQPRDGGGERNREAERGQDDLVERAPAATRAAGASQIAKTMTSSGARTKLGMEMPSSATSMSDAVARTGCAAPPPSAERDAEEQREAVGQRAERHRDRQRLRDDLVHRAVAVLRGDAEIAVRDLRHVLPVLVRRSCRAGRTASRAAP